MGASFHRRAYLSGGAREQACRRPEPGRARARPPARPPPRAPGGSVAGLPRLCRRPGRGLRVVSRRNGDEAPRSLAVGERKHLVQGPARLEGAGFLEVLAFQEELDARAVAQLRRRKKRCAMDVSADTQRGGADVVDRDHRNKSVILRSEATKNLLTDARKQILPPSLKLRRTCRFAQSLP